MGTIASGGVHRRDGTLLHEGNEICCPGASCLPGRDTANSARNSISGAGKVGNSACHSPRPGTRTPSAAPKAAHPGVLRLLGAR